MNTYLVTIKGDDNFNLDFEINAESFYKACEEAHRKLSAISNTTLEALEITSIQKIV